MGALPEIKIFTFLYILDLKTIVFGMLSLSALRIVRPQSFLDLLFSQLLVSWHRRLEFLFLRLIYMFIAHDPTFSSGYSIWTWADIHSLSCSPLLPSHLSSLVFPLLQHHPHPGAWILPAMTDTVTTATMDQWLVLRFLLLPSLFLSACALAWITG